MDAERWHTVKRLLQSALTRPPEEREPFLERECAGDRTLLDEVHSLIAAHAEAGSFLDSMPVELKPGARLGPYEIESLIGAGGMGEVYRARDTRIGREVAIKVLPPDFASDAKRLARFEREAKAISQLDHPNICTLYDVGPDYLVMQLLEGETLAERLARGPLDAAELCRYGAQIADALHHAHRAGIVHRDLKPANVVITRSGAKLLDFGLARSISAEIGSEYSTRERSLTESGTIVGTLHYMAPEQLQGGESDARTDIFAVGAILYEMATGARAFDGATHASLIAAILEHEPPPISASKKLPHALQAVITRCLKKHPGDRYPSADEIAVALRTLCGSGRLPIVGWWPRTRVALRARPISRGRVLAWIGVICVLALVVFLGVRFVRHRMRVAWARNEAIPRITRLADNHEYWQAFLLARRVDEILPGDPLVAKVRPQFTYDMTWLVKPNGSRVWVRPSTGPQQPWVLLGPGGKEPMWTPLGCMLFKVEHPGFRSRMFAYALRRKGILSLKLPAAGEVPREMTLVEPRDPERPEYLDIWSDDFGSLRKEIGTFLIDTHEVTNRQYKAFVEAGGYRRPEFWKHPVVKDGREIPWKDAAAMFVDATGRPGPATWELGGYPEGRGDYPVTGISWFEAAAYAEWAGKRLPTVSHWRAASGEYSCGCTVPGSNFSGTLAPVGVHGVNLRGLYDMAGNAREWCSNAMGEKRITRGGACNDPDYMSFERDSRPALERDPTTGFRCMRALDPAVVPASLESAAAAPDPPDLRNVQPFGDDVWKTWLSLLAYDRTPLASRIELTDDSAPSWRMQKVSFSAAYDGERMLAYLYLPKNARPPYQAVIYWPGSTALRLSTSDDGRNIYSARWRDLVRDGRAVVCPILKGTYDRGGGTSHEWRSRTVLDTKDVMRSIDYIESRSDFDATRVALLGLSWGGWASTLPCARETRLKACILLSGGLTQSRPEVVGWARRITTPIQMVNGRYDSFYDHERSHLPLFRALGTADKDKRLVILNTDHGLSGADKEVTKANLEWLDRYLGPVRK